MFLSKHLTVTWNSTKSKLHVMIWMARKQITSWQHYYCKIWTFCFSSPPPPFWKFGIWPNSRWNQKSQCCRKLFLKLRKAVKSIQSTFVFKDPMEKTSREQEWHATALRAYTVRVFFLWLRLVKRTEIITIMNESPVCVLYKCWVFSLAQMVALIQIVHNLWDLIFVEIMKQIKNIENN